MSILSGFQNIINNIGSTIENAFSGTLVGNLGASITGAFPKTTNTQQTFPLNAYGQTIVQQPLLTQPAAVKISNPSTPAAQRIASANDIQQNSSFNQGYIQAGQPLPGSTTSEVTQFANSGGAGNYQGYVDPNTNKFGYSIPTGVEGVDFTVVNNHGVTQYAPIVKATGSLGTQGQSAGQFGGGTAPIVQQGGGASLLPGSISSFQRSAGGVNPILYDPKLDNVNVNQAPYVKFIGSPNIFDRAGNILTEQQAAQAGIFGPNGTLNNVEQVNTPRPGINPAGNSDQYALLNDKNLTNLELSKLGNVDVSKVPDTTIDTNASAKALYEKINSLIDAGVTSQKELTDQLAANDKLIADTNLQLRDLQLFTVSEIKRITSDPDFSKQLQARRSFWLQQSPQSPTWLAGIALTNQLQYAKDNKQTLLDSFNLKESINKDNFDMATKALDILKPDTITTKVRSDGKLDVVSWTPFGGFVTTTFEGDYREGGQYTTPEIYKASGHVWSISQDKTTGLYTEPKDLGIDNTASGSGAGGGQQGQLITTGDVDALAKNMILGLVAPSQLAASGANSLRSRVIAAVTKINPNFDFRAADSGYKYQSAVSVNNQLASINNVTAGAQSLLDASNAAQRSGITVLNKAILPVGFEIGGTTYSDFRTAQLAFADELSGALGYGSATDMKLKLGIDITDPNMSPAQFNSAINNTVLPFIARKKASIEGQITQNSQPGGVDVTAIQHDIESAIKDTAHFANREALIPAIAQEYGITTAEASNYVYKYWADNATR